MAAYDAMPSEVRRVLRNLSYVPRCYLVLAEIRRMPNVPPGAIAALIAAQGAETEQQLIAEIDRNFRAWRGSFWKGAAYPHLAAGASVLRAETLIGVDAS